MFRNPEKIMFSIISLETEFTECNSPQARLVQASRKFLMLVPIIPPRGESSCIWEVNCKILWGWGEGPVYSCPVHLKGLLDILQISSCCYASCSGVPQDSISVLHELLHSYRRYQAVTDNPNTIMHSNNLRLSITAQQSWNILLAAD